MFKPVPMKRLSLVVLEREEHAVIHGLGRLGAMHLVRTKAGPDTAPIEPPDHTSRIARCDELLARVETLRRRLGLEGEPPQADASAVIALDQVGTTLESVEAKAAELLKRYQAVRQEYERATRLFDQASAYRALDVPLARFGESPFLHFALGTLPASNLDEVRREAGQNVVIVPLPERGERLPVVAVTSRKGRYALETLLEKAGFEPHALAVHGPVTAEKLSEETREKQASLAQDLADAKDMLEAFKCEADQILADMEYAVTVERRILDAEQHFPRTGQTALLTGWVPADDAPVLRRQVQEVTGGRCVVDVADPGDVPDEEIPVLLRHPRILRPFAMLVTGYGLPGYREFEPTLFVAISYVVMFGMMFGDAGQGAVLALAGLGVLLKGRSAQIKDVGVLALVLGLSSVGFGIFYGSYFGITKMGGEELGHDPLSRSMSMNLMAASILIGVGMISVGLILNMINRFRRGDVVGGLLGKFGAAGAVFYWGALALVMKYQALNGLGLGGLAIVLVIVLPLAGIAVKEPIEFLLARRAGHRRQGHAAAGGSLVEAILGSLVEAFEAVIAYLANTVSFVRLAAYAMGHAAILLAAFAMADKVTKASEGPVMSVLGVGIIVLGNLAAILLEGAVALIQAVRLEYYEFFGKFFSGSGRAFSPFHFSPADHALASER